MVEQLLATSTGQERTLSLKIHPKRHYPPHCTSNGNKLPVLAQKVDMPAEKVSAEGIIDADSDFSCRLVID